MKHLYLLFLFLLSSFFAIGQGIFEPPKVKPVNPRWAYDGFSYADFGTGEKHSYFSIVYKLSPKLHMELRGFYDTYRISDITDFSVRAKWYPKEKLYLFSGVGVQMQQEKGFGSMPIMPIRMLNGLGYETDENITLEAIHDLNLSGNGMASPLSLKGKYRF